MDPAYVLLLWAAFASIILMGSAAPVTPNVTISIITNSPPRSGHFLVETNVSSHDHLDSFVELLGLEPNSGTAYQVVDNYTDHRRKMGSTSSSGPPAIRHPTLLIIAVTVFVVLLCVIAICLCRGGKDYNDAQFNSMSVYKSAHEDGLKCSSSVLESVITQSLFSNSRRSKFRFAGPKYATSKKIQPSGRKSGSSKVSSKLNPKSSVI